MNQDQGCQPIFIWCTSLSKGLAENLCKRLSQVHLI